MSLPKIINLSQIVWELWPAQDFGIWGVKNIMKTVRALEHNMPVGPYCYLYPLLSKYFKPHTQEFGLEIHSWEVTRKQQQQRLSFLHTTCLQILIYALQNTIKIFQTIKKSLTAQEFG